jgi:hypothetical protein
MKSLRIELALLTSVGLGLICAAASASDRDLPNRISSLFSDPVLAQPEMVTIPGPLRSLLRMAGISQKIPPESVLPQIARSVYFLGYRQNHETEFLLLLQRYVRQARELEILAGTNNEIRINHCAEAGALLQVLGYSLRNECGHPDASLVTLNSERAFITIDSGFPLTRLEQSLQTDTPFVYAYAPSQVPVLLRNTDWTNAGRSRKFSSKNLLDVLTHDPEVARLYWAFSKIDPETALVLQRSAGLPTLLPYADVLDFYGSELCIRSRRVLVPGGAAAESDWKELVGASPRSPAEFVTHLVARDRGWMALYFDTLSRVDLTQQTELTQGSRLRRLYEALVGADPKSHAAGATFRKAPALLILFTSQQWLPNGEPRIPGGVEMWRLILGKRDRHVTTPEQVLEALVSDSSIETDNGPMQIYLSLSSVDKERPTARKISPQTLLLMANNYSAYSSWYPLFCEFPELSDTSITRFIQIAESIDRISNQDLRGDALGTFQASLSLWQILARQRELPMAQLDSSWQEMMTPFEKISSPIQLFDAGEKSFDGLMLVATGRRHPSQEELIDLLAGPPQQTPQATRIRTEMADHMRSVMDDQRLTSLDTLFELGDGLNAMSHGAQRSDKLISLAGSLREFELPRPIFTEDERYEWAPDITRQRHASLQVHTDLVKTIEQPATPAKLETARGQLSPFLRDTMVGLIYAYYEPPGSQVLHINPMFVRSHDFAAVSVIGEEHIWQTARLFGTGASAGGGAYLVGSLSDLPYVLATTEQNFISPSNVQALIWEQLVPSLLAGATLSRWWNVTPKELHAVALYQETGEVLVTAAAGNPELLEKITVILSDRMSPQRLWQADAALQQKRVADALERLTPAESFYLAVEFRKRYPQETASLGPPAQALDRLLRQDSAETSLERISRDFGTPHPTLEKTYARQLVNGQPFPAFSGASNRLFGESWDSNNLYWARLADEKHDSPEALNVLSPQLTRLMVSKIFATDIEDWPAVQRAMREAGDDLVQGKVAQPYTQTGGQP